MYEKFVKNVEFKVVFQGIENRLVPFRSILIDFFRAAFGHLSHVFRIKIQMHIIDMSSNNSEKILKSKIEIHI